MESIAWLETFPRSIAVGDAAGYCGALEIVLISRSFTPAEDAVVAWAVAQDDSELDEITYLPDGRDLMILRRAHVRQSLVDAVVEQRRHISRRLIAT